VRKTLLKREGVRGRGAGSEWKWGGKVVPSGRAHGGLPRMLHQSGEEGTSTVDNLTKGFGGESPQEGVLRVAVRRLQFCVC